MPQQSKKEDKPVTPAPPSTEAAPVAVEAAPVQRAKSRIVRKDN
jgi:hypothetical protein